MLRQGGRQGGPSGYHSPEGFGDVVRGVWLAPGRFFGRLDPEGGLVRPALFASSVLYLNLIFDELLQAVWRLEFNYGLLNAALPGLAVALVARIPAGLSARRRGRRVRAELLRRIERYADESVIADLDAVLADRQRLHDLLGVASAP